MEFYLFHVEQALLDTAGRPQARRRSTWNLLLADAETAEDLPEEVVGMDIPGDPSQLGLSQAVLFRFQFKGLGFIRGA